MGGTTLSGAGVLGEPVQVLSLSANADEQRLSLVARDRIVDLRLEPNYGLFRQDTIFRHDGVEAPRDVDDMDLPLVGEVEGVPDSWARISFVNGQPDGLVFIPGDEDHDAELWELRQEDGQTTVALFGERAALTLDGDFGPMCGAHKPPANADTDYELTDAPQGAVAECVTLDLALVGDWTYVQEWGGINAAESHTASRMNEIDALYRSTLNVGFIVTGIDLFSSAGQHTFNSASNVSIDTQLNDLGNYRESPSNLAAYNSGLTHLLTSRFQFGTVGLAWVGVTCGNSSYATAVSSDTGPTGTIVTAHELGHNFNAPHDGSGQCASTGGGYIMAPSAQQGISSFSACSESVMTQHVNQVANSFQNCYQPCSDDPGGGDSGGGDSGGSSSTGGDTGGSSSTGGDTGGSSSTGDPTTGGSGDPTTGGTGDPTTGGDTGGTGDPTTGGTGDPTTGGSGDPTTGAGDSGGSSEGGEGEVGTGGFDETGSGSDGYFTGDAGLLDGGAEATEGCACDVDRESDPTHTLLALLALLGLRRRRSSLRD